jgi:hypothetical protein
VFSSAIVTLVPFMFGMYKHVGLEVTLKGEFSTGLDPIFDYPIGVSWVQAGPNVFDTIRTLSGALHFHKSSVIYHRLSSWQDLFNCLQLDDIYLEALSDRAKPKNELQARASGWCWFANCLNASNGTRNKWIAPFHLLPHDGRPPQLDLSQTASLWY